MLPQYFKQAGYVSAAIGKWHVGGKGFGPLEHGFDVYHPGQPNTVPSVSEGGKGEYDLTSFAERFIETNQSRPFLIYLAHNAPHIPYTAQKNRIDHNAKAFEPVYAGVIETIDHAVGRLLVKLEALKLADNTIVIFTSDNGGLHVPEGPHPKITHNSPYRAGKGFVYEGGLRIPLIVRWPGHIASNRVSETPVINTDWIPTLADLAGLPSPSGLDGVSFASLLTKGASVADRKLFWHFPHYTNQGSRPAGAMRDKNWLLIEFYDEDHLELFDLHNDVAEKQNLASKNPARVESMRAALAEWRREVAAQTNAPNPDFDSTKYQDLYVDMDAGQFDPAHASQTQWEKMWSWRKHMNAAVAKSKTSKKRE
jgi:arylsulfatase A-like enzyme